MDKESRLEKSKLATSEKMEDEESVVESEVQTDFEDDLESDDESKAADTASVGDSEDEDVANSDDEKQEGDHVKNGKDSDDADSSEDEDSQSEDDSDNDEEEKEDMDEETEGPHPDSSDEDEDDDSEKDDSDDTVSTDSNTKKSQKKKGKDGGKQTSKGKKLKNYWNIKHNKGYVNFTQGVYFQNSISVIFELIRIHHTLEDFKLPRTTLPSSSKSSSANDEDEDPLHKKTGLSVDSKNTLMQYVYQSISQLLSTADKIKMSKTSSTATKRLTATDILTALEVSPDLGYLDPGKTIEWLDGANRELYMEILFTLMRDNKKASKRNPGKKIPSSNTKKGVKQNSKAAAAAVKKTQSDNEPFQEPDPEIEGNALRFHTFSLEYRPSFAVFDKQSSTKLEHSKDLYKQVVHRKRLSKEEKEEKERKKQEQKDKKEGGGQKRKRSASESSVSSNSTSSKKVDGNKKSKTRATRGNPKKKAKTLD